MSDEELETDLREVEEDEFFQVEESDEDRFDEDGKIIHKTKKESKRDKFRKKLKAERKARNQ